MNSSDHSGHNASRVPEDDTGQAFRQTTADNSSQKCAQGDGKRESSRALRLWVLAGIAITPVMLTAANWLSPRLQLGRTSQDLGTFLLAVSTLVASLYVLARGSLPKRGWVLLGASAGAGLAGLAVYGVETAAAVILVGTCLVALGHTVGHVIGLRIEHPGHLLPACVVAACVDIASVLHPQGPTHAVLSSRRALDLLTLSFPVLGTRAYAPSIGIGDIVFAALVLGTVARHHLSTRRAALLVAAGLLLAGLASALLERAVPALPAIGLCVVLGIPDARHLRSRDRKTATVFMLGAVTLAAGVIASRFLT